MVFRNSIYLGCTATRCVSSIQSNAQNSFRLLFFFPLLIFNACTIGPKERNEFIFHKKIASEKRKIYSSNMLYNLNTSQASLSRLIIFYTTDKSPDFEASLIKLKLKRHSFELRDKYSSFDPVEARLWILSLALC